MEFIKQNIMLIGLALGSGAMLLWPLLRQGKSVSPSEAIILINREHALVLDIREDAEIATGTILGAKHIPLKQLETRLSEIANWKEKPIIVNCQSGTRSSSACDQLQKAGFARVFNLAGGLRAWQDAKLPITKG